MSAKHVKCGIYYWFYMSSLFILSTFYFRYIYENSTEHYCQHHISVFTECPRCQLRNPKKDQLVTLIREKNSLKYLKIKFNI